MAKHLTPKQKVDIIKAFTEELEPVISIAEKHGRTRQAVWKMLKKEGVNTSKRLGNTRLEVSCSACGKIITRNRARVRKQVHHFCDDTCYFSYLEAGNGSGPYIQNRQGQRMARRKVATMFDLQPSHVVHHEDRNCLNNMLNNLSVFACQGDHIRYHRLGPDHVKPLWSGRE